ncbi:MAG TPA: translation initiation factor IF-3, partial [Leptospiraceae bacterium]|nr:translation initiation factor IF-3 [Leptospiraceae bacterium]
MQQHRNRPPSSKDPRINRQITNPKVRLVVEGKGTEVVDTRTAIEQAEARGLDLVEISPDQDPPVCKIVDFGKWKFEQQKRKKEQAKNQHVIQIKEIKLRPKVGKNDYDIKKNQAVSFLEKGDKVKVTL